ncbi:hypothetical protein [Streptacidiphilus sp. EB103A]|uniref:hypothetical protein n=1 Tax=Streptacidiphilus sp. EB103A TaxID=3156275 RepID=UPI0035195BAE
MSDLTESTPAGAKADAPVGPPVGPPSFDTANVWAVPPELLPSRRDRTWLRTALRWTTAAVVCAAVGTGAALGVAAPRRTDLPGLKTPADGRYVFPALKLPALPSGSVGPQEVATGSGQQLHVADLRQLLLPAPVDAKRDPAYPGATGWYPVADFSKKFTSSDSMQSRFQDYGLRHVAATAWTGSDGTRTEVYLLEFRSPGNAIASFDADKGSIRPRGQAALAPDDNFTLPEGLIAVTSVAENADASLRPATRIVCLQYGEIEAVLVLTGPQPISPVVEQQEADLQSELLLG